LNSTKRNINQAFLVQKVELVRVDSVLEVVAGAEVPFKPAASATVGFKPAVEAVIPFKPALEYGLIIYYVYEVTIATKLKGLEDLLLQLLYQSGESLKRDTTAPAVPTNLALTTGMGEKTQAGLTWLKAAWDANTESDLSHYELKYKKTAFSDFGMANTLDTTYLFEGLEQNVEYQVYIRAVDIYGNRSAWSAVQTQTTANDTDAPTQVAGQVATALLAGIKVEWTLSADTNIAYYKVERQESDDGTTWVAAWVEVARVTVDIWLDLILTYIKFYRYRITAYNQSGVAGVTSGVTADSIAANKTGANDIVANCITADQIAADTITANEIQAGAIDTSELAANAVTADKINVTNLSAITADMGTITAGRIQISSTGYIRTVNKTSYADTTAGFWLGYEGGKYKLNLGSASNWLRWTGSTLQIKGRLSVGLNTNEDIYFEDSAIRMYDIGDYKIGIAKSGYPSLFLGIATDGVNVGRLNGSYIGFFNNNNIILYAVSKSFMFYTTGKLRFPTLSSAPSGGAEGDLAVCNLGILHDYYDGTWVRLTGEAGW